jgi:hypothetical protein
LPAFHRDITPGEAAFVGVKVNGGVVAFTFYKGAVRDGAVM